MDYAELERFIKHTMSMSHVYQPVMIRTLLESHDGRATVGDIARAFLAGDPQLVEEQKKVVRRWPHDTLTNHKVVGYERGTGGRDGIYTLLLDGVTKRQRARLVELCDLRLQQFVDKKPKVLAGRPGGPHDHDGHCTMIYDLTPKSHPGCRLCRPENKLFQNKMAYVACAEKEYVIAPHSHVSSFRYMVPAERRMCFDLLDRLSTDHDRFEVRFSSGRHCSIMLVPA